MNNEQEIEKKEIADKLVAFRLTKLQQEKLKQDAALAKRNISDYIKFKLELL